MLCNNNFEKYGTVRRVTWFDEICIKLVSDNINSCSVSTGERISTLSNLGRGFFSSKTNYQKESGY